MVVTDPEPVARRGCADAGVAVAVTDIAEVSEEVDVSWRAGYTFTRSTTMMPTDSV